MAKGDYGNFVTKEEHDEVYRVKKVSNFVSDGSGGIVRQKELDRFDLTTTNPIAVAITDENGDQTNSFEVQQTTYATSSVTQIESSDTSVQLLASNAGRRGAYFFNDSTSIAYLKLGTTAATNSYTVKMAAGSYYELPYPCYTGRIDCIWASANGVMALTEIF
jgi:hypothetical protein